jgi:hypothetical protein
MSQLNVNTLRSPGTVIRVPDPNRIYAPGHIIQVKWKMSMERMYYSIPNNDGGMRGDIFAQGIHQGGTIIRPLDITIAATSINSWVHVEFNLFFEGSHNIVFSVLRDGQLVGAQYNGAQNAGRWVGAGVSRYDNNNDSTPSYINLPWVDRPGHTQPVTYSIAAKSSGASNLTLTLNATLANYLNGADAYEQGVSFSIAQEIAY